MTETDIAWLAGVFEGEACFDYHHYKPTGKKYPRVRVEMNDRDIIERVKALIPDSGEIEQRRGKRLEHSTTYTLRICSKKSVKSTLELIRPYMGVRRGAKIDELLSIYNSQNPAYR